MKIGAMNNPANNLLDEVRLFKEYSLDYVEVTIEAPNATPEKIYEVREELLAEGTPYTTHMPWYMQITSPYESVRDAYLSECVKVLEAARDLGAPYVTIHPDFLRLNRPKKELLKLTVSSLKKLALEAESLDLKLCLENFEKRHFNTEELKKIFEEIPKLGFTLDIGHAHMGTGGTENIKELIDTFTDRLTNVHLHDNHGGGDEHLPLGAGKIDYQQVIRHLKQKYDGNITLEIHTRDRDYIQISKNKVEALL